MSDKRWIFCYLSPSTYMPTVYLRPLLEELLLALLVDHGEGVAHHGDQHVQQQDGQHHLEQDEEQLREAAERRAVETSVLKRIVRSTNARL